MPINVFPDADVAKVSASRKVEGNGHLWKIIFLTKLGTVAPLSCDNSKLTGTGTPSCVASQIIPGKLPPFDSSLASFAEIEASNIQEYSYIITSLSSSASYHVRVSAWNSVGDSYGLTQLHTGYPFSRFFRKPRVMSSAISDSNCIQYDSLGMVVVLLQNMKLNDARLAISEQQIVEVRSLWKLSGHFSLSFEGHTTENLTGMLVLRNCKFPCKG